MTATPIPTKSVGDILGAANWNTLVPLNKAVGILNATAAQTGSLPAVTAPNFQIQAGCSTGTTTSGGGLTITFPTAFTSGLVTVVACVGDNITSQGMVQVVNGSTTAAHFNVVCLDNNGTPMVSDPVRVNWIAIGF